MENRLRVLVKRNHMTQQDFADWFCCGRQTAWMILDGRRPLKADEIVEICNRFNVTADWLLGLSDIENPSEDAKRYKIIKELVQKEEAYESTRCNNERLQAGHKRRLR